MSVGRVLAILELLSQHSEALSLSEMSRRLFCPKVSLLALMNELVSLGYVRRNAHGQFELDSRAHRLGLHLTSSGTLHRVVRETLQQLCERLKLNAAFGYLDQTHRKLVYADRCEADMPVRFTVKLGEQLHIHSRSLGKLLLAFQPQPDWPLWLGPEPYPQVARNTRTTLAALTPDLEDIRRKGMAWAVAEQWGGASGCAAPVRDQDGSVTAGVVVSGPVDAVNGNKARIAREVAAAAATLSTELRLRSITAQTLRMFI
jgi:DNA-binding IclR family transcriptional regulator